MNFTIGRFLRTLGVGSALAALPWCAHAQSPALWEVGGFAGLITAPAYPGSTERLNRSLVFPYFVYRGQRISVDRDGIDARWQLAPGYELDWGASGSFPARSNDVLARQGMPDLGTLVEFGPRLKVKLPTPGTGLTMALDMPLREVFEVNGGTRSQGLVFEPTLVLDAANLADGWSLTAKAGLAWGDQAMHQYFYGVSPQYATPQRPAFEAQAG